MDREARSLLEKINFEGEMPAKDLLTLVPRKTGDYRDFFMAANLMHAGFFDFDAGTNEYTNPLGNTSQATAITFAQIMLPRGETFEIDGCVRESWHDFPVNAFSTAKGFLKLEEMIDTEKREMQESRQKRNDYFMAILTGFLVAFATSILFHFFALERAELSVLNNKAINTHFEQVSDSNAPSPNYPQPQSLPLKVL